MNTNRQRKILYIVTQGNWGGAQKYVFELAKNFNKKFEIVVASGIEDELLGKKITKENIKYIGIKNLVRKINLLKDFRALKEISGLIKKEQPDIVHLNSSKTGVLGSMAAKANGTKKVIFTMHGLVLNEPLNPCKRLIYTVAERLSAFFTDELIAVSIKDKRTAIEHQLKSEKHITVIHNGINLEALNFLPKEVARKKLEIDSDKKVVGIIADLYPAKGIPYLIEAAKMLLPKNPNLQFVLMGRTGPDRKKIEISAEKISGNFKIITDQNQASQYLKAFDIFVLPSVKEGLPYTILEAMAAGLPIVATKVGGIPDICEDNHTALLIDPAKPQQIADSITKLLSSKQLINTLSTNAKKRASDLSLEKMVEETKKLYIF